MPHMNREKTHARALVKARGEGASYRRAVHDVREWIAEGRDPRALIMKEGGTLSMPVDVWVVSPPIDEDEPLLFAVVQADGPAVLAANTDSGPVVDVEHAVPSVVPVDQAWRVDRAHPFECINSLLVDGFAWEVTLEPIRIHVMYTSGERGLLLGDRLRERLDRAQRSQRMPPSVR